VAKHMGRHIIELRLRANAVEDTDNANEVAAAFIAEASRRFGAPASIGHSATLRTMAVASPTCDPAWQEKIRSCAA
jgi:hypothetical protein